MKAKKRFLKFLTDNHNSKRKKSTVLDDEEEETAFFSSQFKGKCRKCGKMGHKAADCRSGDDGKSKRFNGKCNYCGIFGHKEADCQKKKAAEKIPVVRDKNSPSPRLNE